MCTRDVWMSRVWHLNGKSNMICGQRVCVCGGAHEQPTNNRQSVELRVGFTTLVAVASSILCQRNDGAISLCLRYGVLLVSFTNSSLRRPMASSFSCSATDTNLPYAPLFTTFGLLAGPKNGSEGGALLLVLYRRESSVCASLTPVRPSPFG